MEEQKELDPAVGAVLRVIHRYRNEAYHRDRVRREIVRPVVLLLYEVVCDLLPTLRAGATCFVGGEDYGWFEKRYGFRAMGGTDENGLRRVSDVLRRDLPLTLVELREALVGHLETRLSEIIEALNFFAESLGDRASTEEALKVVQFYERVDVQDGPDLLTGPEYQAFEPDWTMNTIEGWREEIRALESVTDKLALFKGFADIEKVIEPLETFAHEAAASWDQYVQMQIDIARGK